MAKLKREPKPVEQWYYFDPDNRRNPPVIRKNNGRFKDYAPHCCRCNKGFKPDAKFRRVTVDWDKMIVKSDPKGEKLMGENCWKQVIKNPFIT